MRGICVPRQHLHREFNVHSEAQNIIIPSVFRVPSSSYGDLSLYCKYWITEQSSCIVVNGEISSLSHVRGV